MFELAFQRASLASTVLTMVVCLKVAKQGIMNFADLHPTISKLYKYSVDINFVPEIVLRVSKSDLVTELVFTISPQIIILFQ